MKIQIPSLFFTAGMLAASLTASADNSPLWLRNSAISPDGRTIAFTFMGDIYTVPASGGKANQITTSTSYDTRPVWSPDGSKIAFSSDRKGSLDIYVVDADGGTPKRLTSHSGTESPLAFLNDSTIVFSANIMPDMRAINGFSSSQIYTVGVDVSRPHLLMSLPSDGLSIDASGRILFQDKKGYEDKFRKHERSSGTSDIWMVSHLDENPVFTRLTDFNGHDINPQWIEADRFAFLSEEDGTLNIYERNVNGSAKRQLTYFDTHPVRSLSVARNGAMAFSQNGEIYTLNPGDNPKKVDIEIIRDCNASDTRKISQTSGATAAVLSPNGKEVAFILRGDVFVTSVEYNTTKQITKTSGQERNVQFSPDGRSLIYDSERNGIWQIFQTTLSDPDEKLFTYSTSFEEKPLISTGQASFQPRISPDGKKLAFLENRTTLKVLDLESGKVNTAMDGKFAYSYTDGDLDMHWSPDSRWLLFDGYLGNGGWNNIDIAAISADGSEIIDLTRSGYSDNNSKWTHDGKGVTYQTDKYGYRSHGSWGSQEDICIMFLDGEAFDRYTLTKEESELAKESKAGKTDGTIGKKDKKSKKKDKNKDTDSKTEKLAFDFANRDERSLRITRHSASMGDYFLTPDMDKLYYVAKFEKGGDLWMIDLKKGEEKIIEKDWGYGRLQPDSAGTKLFSLSNGRMKILDTSNNSTKYIDFKAVYDFSPSVEREYIFSHMYQQVKDKFYDKSLHGVDWDKYTAEYRRFLPYISNDIDFAEMLSEVLGELNASHTGGRAYTNTPALEETAFLGAFFDDTYTGDGLKVSEIITRGPIAIKANAIKAGDIITAIDGTQIKAGEDYFPLLAGKAGERVRITVAHSDGKSSDYTVKPVDSGANRSLLYKRWVERNQKVTDSISGGKIGYVHIQGMDSPSFRTIYDEVLGRYRNCDAIIVDTRYNGGGWLHNDVALLFNGKKYVDYMPRGQYIGSDPFSQWTKQSAMLINESNYSDAHGTPYVYKTLGIGKLIGAPVPGTMTAVWWENQINPAIVFGIPQVTSVDVNGNVLENQQLNPNILIYNQPNEFLNGTDAQLIEAIKSLMSK